MRLQEVEKIIFLLLVFLMPTQLGKHFWFDFSYVSGIKIDYLSPTLYSTDVLVVILFVLWCFSFFKAFLKKELRIINYKLRRYGIIFFALLVLLFDLMIGAVFSKSPLLSLYGAVKVFEMIFFGLYIWKTPVSLRIILFTFISGVVLQSVLSLLQIVNQGSLNGIFYFFGERSFSASTPGIANASISGQLVLRPYATLPHPNVLAAYLLVAVEFLLLLKNKNNRFFLFFPFILFSTTLPLTLSRVAISLWIFIISMYAFLSRKKFAIPFVVIVLFVAVLTTPLLPRIAETSFTEESFVTRTVLINASFAMIASSPVFGVGTLQFIPTLPSLLSDLSFSQLQPVHNIYLLFFSEAGAVGIALFLWFLFQTAKVLAKGKKRLLQFLLFGTVLALGFFDHYFLTLQQGQFLFAFVLGLLWKEKAL